MTQDGPRSAQEEGPPDPGNVAPEDRECEWCGFKGEAPDEWWHLHRPEPTVFGMIPPLLEVEADPVFLCDLCFNTGRGYSKTLEIVNHAANRVLEMLRAMNR